MKRAGRIVAGFVIGFIVTAALSMGTTAALRTVWPALGTAAQGPWLEALDFAYALTYMGLGAWAAARVGGRAAAYALGAAFVLLGLATAALGLDPAHSAVYQWLLALAAGVAAWLGARAAGANER